MKNPALPAVLLGLFLVNCVSRAQSTIDPVDAFAWASNVGWTNWRPSLADGAVIGEYVCSGSVFCANIGWVNMGSGTPANGIRYGNAAAGDYGVNFMPGGTPGFAMLRGFAYGANIGWINFENLGNAVLDLTTGDLTGYAWSANCGWINLGSGTPYGVTTVTIAPAADTDTDGIGDAFELENFGDLTTASATSDADGDGTSDLAEARAGTDPLDPADNLRMLDMSLTIGVSTAAATLTFTSNTTRLYRIEKTEDLTLGVWSDSGLGNFPADGATTTRTAEHPATPQRFYRVVAIRPLAP